MKLDYTRIYCLMAERGLSQKEVSERCGYSREAVRKAIKGQVNCKPRLTGAIAKALDVKPEEIIMNNQ